MKTNVKNKEYEMNTEIDTLTTENYSPLAIAVLNYVSCGKTTISRQLLSPRLGEARIVPIESINADTEQDDALNASSFREAMVIVDNLIANNKSVIVDIGASNVEACLTKMKKEKAFEDFDYFVLPCTPDKRTITNTSSAIVDLISKFNVDASKIKVIFNRVPADSQIPIEVMFAPIFKIGVANNIEISSFAVVHDTEVFDLAGTRKLKTVSESKVDYRDLQRKATTQEQRAAISTERVLFKMSGDMVDEMDSVFDVLFVGQ